MSKTRVGVMGAGRGMTMVCQLMNSKDAELAAVCDFYPPDFGRSTAGGRKA